MLVFCITGLTFVVYRFGDQKTKDFIECNALVAIDFVRESSAAPDELVLALDLLAARLPFARGNVVPAGTSLEFGEHVLAGTPVARAGSFIFLKNRSYLVSYDIARKNPAWCAYKIFAPKDTKSPARPDFLPDTRVPARFRVEPSDYTNSGFDRGHMAPNQAIAACYGRAGQEETFLMSNIVPQFHALNAGTWKELEQRVFKRYTRAFGEIWVICGPIYDSPAPKRIRKNIAVPDAFFMIVVDCTENATGSLRALAFIVPHEKKLAGTLKKYLVSIDEVEARAGLDFFPKLATETQNQFESLPAKTIW